MNLPAPFDTATPSCGTSYGKREQVGWMTDKGELIPLADVLEGVDA